MTCATCAAAELEPTADAFASGCRSCMARAFAVTGAHLDSAEAGALTPSYRDALQLVFGGDWLRGHDLVKGWAAKLRQAASRGGA